MKVKSVTYAITKQVRQYEPVRVEVTVESTSGVEDEKDMFLYARTLCENAIIEAVQRGPVI